MNEHEPEQVEVEVPAQTAPTLPVEHFLHYSATFYQRQIGGGMLVKFVPLVATPAGNVPAPEAYCVEFSPEGWDRFKREVAADGARGPVIETARHVPGGFLNGGH